VISDETDQISNNIHQSLGGDNKVAVKLTRSRAETRLLIVLKGKIEETEEKLQKIYKRITS